MFNPNNLIRLYRGLFKDGVVSVLDIRFHTDETKSRDFRKGIGFLSNLSIRTLSGTATEKATSDRIHEYIPGLAGSLLVDELNHMPNQETISPM
jgi:hypothetical protein